MVSAEKSTGYANWQFPLLPLLLGGDYELFKVAYERAKNQSWGWNERIPILGVAAISSLIHNNRDDAEKYLAEIGIFCQSFLAKPSPIPASPSVTTKDIRFEIRFLIEQSSCEPYRIGQLFLKIAEYGNKIKGTNEPAARIVQYFQDFGKHLNAITGSIYKESYPSIYGETQSIFRENAEEIQRKMGNLVLPQDKHVANEVIKSSLDLEQQYLMQFVNKVFSLIMVS